MDESRYQLVDSLYGPGTVGAWLLTLCALLVSWTLNVSSRRKDTISIDFIAALLLPLIAAGHLFFQVSRLPFSVAEAITAQDVEVQQYAAAMEAPLNVCETFSMVALVLAVCCGGPWWGSDPKRKRLGLVIVVGLLSWGTENVLFAMAMRGGVQFSDATLSRPYLFFLAPFVTMTWGFLALCIVVAGVVLVISRRTTARRQDIERNPGKVHRRLARNYLLQLPKKESNSSAISRDSLERMTARLEGLARASVHEARVMRMVSVITMFYLPGTFIATIVGLSRYEPKETPRTHSRQFFLIPKSSGSMSSLDQILALVGGFLVLYTAVRSAYRSRMDREQPSEKVIQRRLSI